MSNTIDDFLGYLNPNKAKESFHINDSISDSLNLIKSLIDTSSVDIVKNIESDFVLSGVKMEITQVVINLITNAIQAFEKKQINEKSITISAYEKDYKNYLIIEDTAGGINESNLEKIFDPYFTTKSDGTGVGLYMVKLIVMNSFSGKLSLENSKLGLKFIMEFET
jgi:signal transduction histidine kinase